MIEKRSPITICCSTVIILFCLGTSSAAQTAPSSDNPAYLDSSKPLSVRVDDLVSRMTLEEKASQLVNQARAIPRLQVPAYDWWSEALHGVAQGGNRDRVSRADRTRRNFRCAVDS